MELVYEDLFTKHEVWDTLRCLLHGKEPAPDGFIEFPHCWGDGEERHHGRLHQVALAEGTRFPRP
jgi:hypothetical protein